MVYACASDCVADEALREKGTREMKTTMTTLATSVFEKTIFGN